MLLDSGNFSDGDIRLPLDILLVHDVDYLEDGLNCTFALIHENDIHFCKNKKVLENMIEEMEIDTPKWYEIDEVEKDRICAVIDLLNMADENTVLSHILDRLVR